MEVVTWNKSSESNRKKKRKRKRNRPKLKLNQRLYNLEKLNSCLTFLLEREALVLHRKSVGSLSLGLYLVIVFSSVISA